MLNVREQKAELNLLENILNDIRKTEDLFENIDEEHCAKEVEKLEWRYKSEIQRISQSLLNKDNVRVIPNQN